MSTPPPCPSCGTPSESTDERTEGGVVTGSYTCGEHVWITKWPEVA